MQAFVQIPDRNAPRLAFARLCVEDCRGEVELRRPLEAEPALPNVALVLGGIEGYAYSFIVYAIYVYSARKLWQRRKDGG